MREQLRASGFGGALADEREQQENGGCGSDGGGSGVANPPLARRLYGGGQRGGLREAGDGELDDLAGSDVLPLEQAQEASVEVRGAEVVQSRGGERSDVGGRDEPQRLGAEPHRPREIERGRVVVEAVDEFEAVRLAAERGGDGRREGEALVHFQDLPAGDVGANVQVVGAGRERESQETQHRGAFRVGVGREGAVAVVANDGAL